jgi:hypothetical protein
MVCLAPPDGSVIFWENGFLVRPIERATGSDLVHVAIILYEDGIPYVYEATWPRVQKMTYVDYIQHLESIKQRPHLIKLGFKWFILQPIEPYTFDQLDAMKKYARSQLGREYMMRGYWKNREVRGIMCSQYVSLIIAKSGRIKSANFKESPISLRKKIQDLYK